MGVAVARVALGEVGWGWVVLKGPFSNDVVWKKAREEPVATGSEGDRTSEALDERRGLAQIFVQPSSSFFGFAEKKEHASVFYHD